jgi:hypothetical protein
MFSAQPGRHPSAWAMLRFILLVRIFKVSRMLCQQSLTRYLALENKAFSVELGSLQVYNNGFGKLFPKFSLL